MTDDFDARYARRQQKLRIVMAVVGTICLVAMVAPFLTTLG